MKRFAIHCAVLVLSSVTGSHSLAAILYESGTLGSTGVTWSDVENQAVLGANISMFAYNGVKFQLTQPVLTTEIGGHFVAPVGGTFFGALIALDNEADFPDSGDLSTADVLGHALLPFPTSSAEVFGDLALSLNPGWYALVFGSGLFGATGRGAALLNNPDIDNPSYIGHQPLSGFGWGTLINPIFRNYRFAVNGEVVPETTAFCLSTIASCLLLFFRVRETQ